MKNYSDSSRRKFIKTIAASTAAVAVGTHGIASENKTAHFTILKKSAISPGDTINIGLIGSGGMGVQDTITALSTPGVRLIAACDLYDGRLKDAKDKWGKDLFTTRNYKEVLNRKDIDAVIVATPDHWHQQISIDAMKAGKHVYCEKPMVHSIAEGPAVIQAQKETGKIFQVGSQGVSSLGNEKAKELLKDGAIGELNYAEGFWARHSPVGAWQYPIPADASPATVDWDTYISNTNKRPFDKLRFFRWRNYLDYGTGMSGDLFVHLFSSLHFITNSKGPQKIMAMGGLRFWKDGREVPDVLMGMFDYPETQEHPGFNLSLRVNFVDGTADSTYLRLVGSEGSMNVEWDKVTLTRNKAYAPTDDPLLATKLNKDNPSGYERKKILPPNTTVFEVEKGYKGAHFDHFNNFFTAIREKKSVVEDALFGYRAAAPALLCNDSYFTDKPVKWDPIKLKLG